MIIVKEINVRVKPMNSSDPRKMLIIIGLDRTKQTCYDKQDKCIHILEVDKVILEPTDLYIDSLWCKIRISMSPSDLDEDGKLNNELRVGISVKNDRIHVDSNTKINML